MSAITEQFIQKAILNTAFNEKCIDLHPGLSCNFKMLQQFTTTCRAVYKMYLLVHLIPFLLFKRKKLNQRPFLQIKKLIIGLCQSLLFAGGYTLIVRRTICFFTQHFSFKSTGGIIGGFLGGASLIFQPAGRQSEIALFCVNKTLQTLYHMGRRRNYPIKLPYGECLMLGLAVGVICYHYNDCPASIRDNYMKVLQRIVGNV